MEIKKLTILGKSDAVITMILDNLESNETFPNINIINNINLPIVHPFDNSKFDIKISEKIDNYEVCFFGVGKPKSKKELYNLFEKYLETSINVINKNTFISSTVKLGKGILINSMVSIASYSEIGNFVTINRNSSIGHHTTIGNFVSINPGVNVAGFCNICEGTTIGIGTNVVDGITIGKNSIIGAGSLVTKDIPDNVLAYGIPCKVIKEL
jgi:sugar O-acyltransferase (sialic acid O-acetyltransferase NeuD family)